MQCGLLGKQLSHSYSPRIHRLLGQYLYALYEIAPENLGDFLKNAPFTGINVTIPYKKDVLPYCEKLTREAQLLGAVNTILRQEDGSLFGHNTDYFGFQSMVRRTGLELKSKKVLVLGSGGASATVTAVLQALGAEPVIISRGGNHHYGNLHLHKDGALIVNTTPVGMYPDTDVSPVNLSEFPNLEGVLDLIYNPGKTALLIQAEARGLVAENGLWMLVAQAKESAQWFTGTKIPDSVIGAIYTTLKLDAENLVLIGMPGCGKSTVGKLLAEETGKRFVDSDEVIEKMTGLTIPELFSSRGEAHFRQLEQAVIRDLGKESSLVIATGGGCVTKAENYPALHQNGTIIWLKRALDKLAIAGRPLSQHGDLQKMYAERAPLYRDFADITADNRDTPEAVAAQILSYLGKGDLT